MKMIIAPTDFSPVSLNAVEYAADMAADLQANLLLVHIVELIFTEAPIADESYDITIRQSRQDLFALQEKLIARTRNTINIETHIGMGTLLGELNRICNLHEPFAVVMGTEERDFIERLFIGNSTKAAVHYLHYPILVVPATTTYKKVSKICLAIDLKDIYDLPVDKIKELVAAFNAKLDIVHVCKNDEEKLQCHLAATLVENQFSKLHPKIEFIINKDIDEGIRQYAAKQQEDMMLAIPKKRSFMESIFHKRSAKAFSKHPPMSVINILESTK